MTFAWDNGLVYFIVSLVLILAIFGGLFFVLFKVARRRISFIFLGITFAVFLVSFIFDFFYVAVLSAFIAAACLAVTFFCAIAFSIFAIALEFLFFAIAFSFPSQLP